MLSFRRLSIAIFFLSLGLLAGCMGTNEEFIQGEWQFNDPHFHNFNQPRMISIWTFDRGYFYYAVCCYDVNTEVHGNYEIVKDEENVLILDLYNIEGEGMRGSSQVRIEINSPDDTLQIYTSGPYERMTPKYDN
ncbi:MAG: hypothetical protein H6636_05025 [Anaerolineales bacterium]|nr:hypothetical protein [Anaerolineales bacterium]